MRELFALQRRGLVLLLGWGLASIALGRRARTGGARGRSFGRHFGGWGVFALTLALGGLAVTGAYRRCAEHQGLSLSQQRQLFAATRRILRLSIPLDLLLLAGGARAVRHAGGNDARRGMGWAMVAHSCFYIPFDTLHLLLLRRLQSPERGASPPRHASGNRRPEKR